MKTYKTTEKGVVMPKISVIMPCLNMVKYITDCLDSVINQTLKDIEILIVDAGSTDGTLDILENFERRDNRIKLIHSEIKSYGYQMNLGIEEAAGEYIGIVDTDDKIVSDMYEILYQTAVTTEADYVKGTADYFYMVKGCYNVCLRNYMQFPIESYKVNGIEVIPKDTPDILLKDAYLWYGVYRRDFIKQFKFHESLGAAYQDFGMLLQTHLNAKKAIYIEKAVYEYRQDNMQASGYNPKGFEFIMNEYRWGERFLLGKSKEWHKTFYCKLFLQILSRFHVMVHMRLFWNGTEKAVEELQKKINWAKEEGIIEKKDFTQITWEYLELFLSAPKELYKVLDEMWEPYRAEVYQVLEAVVARETVIFGCGKLGTFLHLLILNNEIENVIAFCDNNKSQKKELLYGLGVFTPSEAAARYPDAVYIIANKKYGSEMKRQLIGLGIDEKQIVQYMGGYYQDLFRERLL